ncbi:hypothetical protein JZU54_03975, partial [bacterium]|nr:hypothetical protein [bacterium]
LDDANTLSKTSATPLLRRVGKSAIAAGNPNFVSGRATFLLNRQAPGRSRTAISRNGIALVPKTINCK